MGALTRTPAMPRRSLPLLALALILPAAPARALDDCGGNIRLRDIVTEAPASAAAGPSYRAEFRNEGSRILSFLVRLEGVTGLLAPGAARGPFTVRPQDSVMVLLGTQDPAAPSAFSALWQGVRVNCLR